MKRISPIASSLVLLVMINLWSTVAAQQLESFLSKLQMEQWIEFEGAPRQEFTILVNEIKILEQEMEDDDWEVSGAVTRVAPEEQTIYIMDIPIQLDNTTAYADAFKSIKSFSDIKPGMAVKVRGQYTGEGVFLGFEVESKEFKKDGENVVKCIGKVEGVEPESHSINILGHIIVLTPETQISSPYQE